MSPKNLKDPKAVKAAFANLLNDFTEEELLEMEALAIGHAYLSEAQRVMDERNMLRKHLAEKMNVSASFLTQLFRGDRPVSDYHKAQLQRVLGVRFEVKAVDMAGRTGTGEFNYPQVAEDNYMLAWHKVSGGFDAARNAPAPKVDYYESAA
jgi:transcriptional regulator with XRE-family HTH domain